VAATLESLDTKLDMLCQDVGEVKARLTVLNGTIRDHDRSITRLEERQAIGNVAQGVLSTILASLAAYLGMSH